MITAQSTTILADSVVLVTGAAGAIGAATASSLAQTGARMLLADLFPADDERISKLQHVLPEPALYIACNISDEAQVMTMVERAIELHGRLDGAGHRGEMYRAAYVASKAGVIGLTKTAAVEAATSGVRVNAVSPGPVGTAQFNANVGPPGSERYRRVIEAIPDGRTGGPGEIADIICWLLSGASSFVIGHEVIADGGITAEGLAAPRLVQLP